jgi:hypothetical protein
MSCATPEKSDMKFACENIEDFGMNIGSPDLSLSTHRIGRRPE